MACLCAPTSHEGSFRCRLHRAHPIKAVNYCANGSNSSSNQIDYIPYYITVRESSASPAAATPHPFVGDNVRFSHCPQVAADRLSTPMRSSLPLATFASSSSSSSLKLPSYRLPSSSSSSSSSFSSSSSSRASASSSSPSPSSPFSCTRPPAAKRLSSSSSSPTKSPFRVSSPPTPSSWCAGATASNITPSASHAAAMAIMKQHSHNKHGARAHNRNALSPTSASKIGPSRLSRMAVACTDERPISKEDQNYISGSHQHGSAPDTLISSSFADNPRQSGLGSVETAQIKAAQMGLKMCSAINKFKQSESSCRTVGSKEGSLIMPTVY